VAFEGGSIDMQSSDNEEVFYAISKGFGKRYTNASKGNQRIIAEQ
jgi:hypothetical protein